MRNRNGLHRTVRTASERKLRLETLECRRLLAGDSCAIQQERFENGPIVDTDFQSVQSVAADFRATDSAGSSLRTAANLGIVEGTIQRGGRLSRFDRIDVARFEIKEGSNVRIALDRLTEDADLHVLDRSGNLIASSTRSGRRSEVLSGTLRSGEFYLAVTAGSFRNSSYRLSIDVQPIVASPEPVPTTQTPPPSPPQVPSPTPVNKPSPPSAVGPLAEVAYFGDNRDWNINAVAAPEAWAAGYRGQGVTVAVIDTGVDLDHPDLRGNLYVNPGEIAGNGIDDDRNGYVDDVSGFDFVAGDSRPDDGNGHGTHVAGTIAASNNGVGATGVAPDAKILPIRVLDDKGSGSDASVAAGIRYAAEMGAHLINLSLGGGASSRIASAINYATSLGSLVIAAAGNESASSPSYPARHSAQSTGVLSVGAYNSSNQVAGFSNDVGGSGAVQIDAPGVGIYSTYAGGGYRSLSGTSMAAPHVAGVAALILSANPKLTSSELRQLLTSGTVGRVSGSDSIGKASTLNSVAYAAAGLTTAGGQSSSNVSTAGTTSARVRATREVAEQQLATPLAFGTHDDEGITSIGTASIPQRLAAPLKLVSSEPLSVRAVDDVFASRDFEPDPQSNSPAGDGTIASLAQQIQFPVVPAA